MKKLSCGFLIKDTNTGLYLGCIPTGSKDKLCDIPKGGIDENEDKLTCALRELYEETGIIFEQLSNIKDHGRFSYLAGKDLYLFTADCDICLKDLYCSSMFEQHGKFYYEMSGFKLGDLDIFRDKLKVVLEKII